MRTRLKTYHVSSHGRKELGEESGYAFCSRTKPAIIAEKGGQTKAFYLAPFSKFVSPEASRQNTNFHALYFGACHGIEAGRAAVRNLRVTAQALGYHVALQQSQFVTLSRVTDVLAPAGQELVSAAGQTPLIPPRDIPLSPSRNDPFDRQFEARRGADRGETLFDPPRLLADRALDTFTDVGDWMLGW